MAGVTDSGFVTKRFPEVIEDLREQAVPLFQDLVSPGDVVDTSDSTVLGRLIGLNSLSLTELWEALQEVYAAFDPNTATGVPLVNLVALGGLSPQEASRTSVSCFVWGDVYTDIPPQSRVSTESGGVELTTDNGLSLTPDSLGGVGLQITDTTVGTDYAVSFISYSGTFNVSTTAIVDDTEADILGRLLTQLNANVNYTSTLTTDTWYVKLVDHYSTFDIILTGPIAIDKVGKRLDFSVVDTGPTAVALNTVTTIVTPVLGWDSVVNTVPAVLGSYAETDEELRERFRTSKYLRAANTTDALYSALQELTGVTEVKLYVNDTGSVDSIGLPAHSFLVLLIGGNDTDIANVIWKHTPLGIASQGAQEVSILTAQGFEQVVKFDRPVYVPIYAEIELDTFTGFPVGGEVTIASNLSNYVTDNQVIGGKVIYSRLFGPVNEVPGHEIVSLKIGTSAMSVAETTLTLAYNEIPVLPIENITFI